MYVDVRTYIIYFPSDSNTCHLLCKKEEKKIFLLRENINFITCNINILRYYIIYKKYADCLNFYDI